MNKKATEVLTPVLLILSLVFTINFLFLKNLQFLNNESYLVLKIKKYLVNLEKYETCVEENKRRNCILLHYEMINSRDEMDDTIQNFYGGIN